MILRSIQSGILFFIHFHKGAVNIVLHIAGFLLLFYSLFIVDWKLFATSIIIIEVGHVYNHIAKIEPYDFRPKVCFWRVIIFLLLVIGVYALGQII